MLPVYGREEKSERTSSNLNVLPHWKFIKNPLPVSYTHLDVYKRQRYDWSELNDYFRVKIRQRSIPFRICQNQKRS